MAALGDLAYRGASVWKRLVGQTTTTKKYLSQTGSGSASAAPVWAQVADADLSVTDVTTNNVTTSAHGFTPKAPNDTTKFLRGDATWAVATGTGDVVGPGSATDNAITRFDGTTGKLVQNSGITIADAATGTLDGSNSGDVTLAGSPTYLTLAAQVITRALIDLTAHVTGRLPFANLVAATTGQVLIGKETGSGSFEEVAIGSGLNLTAGLLTASGGGGGAPDSATYVTLTTNGGLSNERVLTAGTGISLTDGGAGSTITVAVTATGAPDSADYVVETANAGLSAESVLGTTVITTAADASKQAAAKAGRLFLPNDGFYLYRDTGSAWVPWGPIFPLTDPALAAPTTWVNQGGASVSSTNGGIFLAAPATSGDSFRLRVKTAPSTPYVITAMLTGFGAPNLGTWGLAFRESSSGKLHFLMIGGAFTGKLTNAPGIASIKFTNETTFSATYTSNNLVELPMEVPPRFLRIADNGTNRTISVSSDGVNFLAYHTIGRTDFLTANQVGFFANAASASIAAGVTLLSWKET